MTNNTNDPVEQFYENNIRQPQQSGALCCWALVAAAVWAVVCIIVYVVGLFV